MKVEQHGVSELGKIQLEECKLGMLPAKAKIYIDFGLSWA